MSGSPLTVVAGPVGGQLVPWEGVESVTLTEPVWGSTHIAKAWEGTRRILRDAPLPPLP